MIESLLKPEAIAAIAAVFSAIATGFAVWAAIEGPKKAAALAETLRSQGDSHAERRRAKLNVFAVLMANRAAFWVGEALHAFNLIDVVFNDSKEVRSAWAEMYLALNTKNIPDHTMDEKMRVLLGAMAKDLGLADELRTDDFGRVYSSTAAAEERLVADLQRKKALDSLTGDTPPSANTAGTQSLNDMFPPKPD